MSALLLLKKLKKCWMGCNRMLSVAHLSEPLKALRVMREQHRDGVGLRVSAGHLLCRVEIDTATLGPDRRAGTNTMPAAT